MEKSFEELQNETRRWHLENEEFEHILMNASRIKSKGYFTEEEARTMRKTDGAKRLKRAALGIFGESTIKSLDEMAQLLCQTGVSSSLECGKILTQRFLTNRQVSLSGNYTLEFDLVKNAKGQEKYRIQVFNYDL